MKRSILPFVAMALLLVASVGCDEVEPVAVNTGALDVVIRTEVPTKASDATELNSEKMVKTLDVYVFNGAGTSLYAHYSKSDMTLEEGVYSKEIPDAPEGTYTVVAVANGPSGISGQTSWNGVANRAITLDLCDPSGSRGFVMGGITETTVSSGSSTECAVAMDRYCSRIKVTSITNAASSPLYIGCVYLENVYSNWYIDTRTAVQGPWGWANLAGRQEGSSNSTNPASYITSFEDSQYYDQLLYEVLSSIAAGASDDTDHYLYCFPTFKTSDHTGPTTNAQAESGILPRLVVRACFPPDYTYYYYPVTLFPDGTPIQRNTSYDVSVTISGPGSDDPNTPISAGVITASVDVQAWGAGASYTEPI